MSHLVRTRTWIVLYRSLFQAWLLFMSRFGEASALFPETNLARGKGGGKELSLSVHFRCKSYAHPSFSILLLYFASLRSLSISSLPIFARANAVGICVHDLSRLKSSDTRPLIYRLQQELRRRLRHHHHQRRRTLPVISNYTCQASTDSIIYACES